MVGQPCDIESMLPFKSVWEAKSVIGVADSDVESLAIGIVDSMVGGTGVVESMLSFRSVWEAESAIAVR